MDEIKSAWEIAADRTKDISIDKDAASERENVTCGKKLVSQYLDDPEKIALDKEIKKLSGKTKQQVSRGMLETLLLNFTLPLTEFASMRNARVHAGLTALAPGVKQVDHILKQIDAFFKNFSEGRVHLEEDLEEQYAPRLRQKIEALAKQLGARVELKAAQDPEFVALVKKNLTAFDERYNEALAQAKAEIKRIVLAAL